MNISPMLRSSFVMSLALCFTLGTAGYASVLFYEGFDYTAASTLDGQGGWGSGILTVDGSSLTYGSLETSGGSAHAAQSSAWNNQFIDTGVSNPAGGVRWVSFLMQEPEGITEWQNHLVRLGDEWTNEFIQVGNVGSEHSMGTGASYSGTATSFTTGATTASPTFYALKYDYDATEITFYFNPTPGNAEGSLAPLGTLNATDHGLTLAQMSLGGIKLHTTNLFESTASFDEIRIGDTWADVSAIPEPSTLVMVLLSAVTLLVARLRRR